MALSPAQRHSAMIQAQRKLDNQQAIAGWDSLHIQVRAMESDIARLRNLPTIADRILMKRDVLLPRWQPTVEAYLAAGDVHANPIFAWCVIWLFDVGDFDLGLDWVDIAIAQRQQTPDRMRRSFAAFAADTVLAWAEEEAAQGNSVEPYFSRTFENVRDNWRLHEEISAKWFKFAGLLLLRENAPAAYRRPVACPGERVKRLPQAKAGAVEARHFGAMCYGNRSARFFSE